MKAKSLKYFSKGVLLLVKLEANDLPLLHIYFKVFLTLMSTNWSPGSQAMYIRQPVLLKKCPKAQISDSMYYSIFMLENIYHNFT